MAFARIHKVLIQLPSHKIPPHTRIRCTALDIKGKNIIVGNVNPNLLSDAEDLEFLQLNSAGYDNYVGKLPKKTILCTSVGAFSPAVGEHILAMTFSLIRHFHLYRDKQNRKDWSDCGKITSVEGSTIAVFGFKYFIIVKFHFKH